MIRKKGEDNRIVAWFSELKYKDIAIAGGKGASLAEMYNNKFPIPPGFIVTAQAYSYFVDNSGVKERMKLILNDLNVNDTEKLNEASRRIRELIEGAEFPKEIEEAIV